MLLVSETLISFPMPSDSGKAMITLPLMIPLALLGLLAAAGMAVGARIGLQ